MSRTVSARIPTDLHEELRERCNLVGESINDYVKTTIEFALHETVDFDLVASLFIPYKKVSNGSDSDTDIFSLSLLLLEPI